ncbi:MAG: HPr family phosphocarrier protein [Bacteroidales bacterium]|nr:MAG: HPr family phosphocarrier protein [Bacteroidales bacterium]
MKEIVVKVNDMVGLHARTASLFSKKAAEFSSTIKVYGNNRVANGKSMLNLIALGIRQGMDIKITAEGDDDASSIEALYKLVINNFK